MHVVKNANGRDLRSKLDRKESFVQVRTPSNLYAANKFIRKQERANFHFGRQENGTVSDGESVKDQLNSGRLGEVLTFVDVGQNSGVRKGQFNLQKFLEDN